MLRILNTLSKELEEFKPINDNKVSFYHCGPTVYWVQHIGNMRGMTLADLIRRSLMYLDYEVKFVRNYTDVGHLTSDEDEGEDKMEKGAKREGLSPQQIADKYIALFEKDIALLNNLKADFNPRATEYVQKMIEIVKVLFEKGYAYSTPNAIYFDVSKKADYNKLNRQQLDENLQGAGFGDVSDKQKRNPWDFALWFFKTGAHKNALQTWESPFESSEVENGEGFPGWHIECSAMSQELLGDTLDIHMGGIEHISVHHTNEIAQSESYTGKKFVNYWIHNEHLTIDGEKMSKSIGNVYNVDEIISKGFDPIALRYFFLQSHYRSKQNFTWKSLEASQSALNKLKRYIGNINESGRISDEYKSKFISSIENDFNLPQALSIVWDLLKSDIPEGDKKATVLDFNRVLGLNISSVSESSEIPAEVAELIKKREEARTNKNWEDSDKIRDDIFNLGYEVKDSKDGQTVSKR